MKDLGQLKAKSRWSGCFGVVTKVLGAVLKSLVHIGCLAAEGFGPVPADLPRLFAGRFSP
jgi:hypothetical protein